MKPLELTGKKFNKLKCLKSDTGKRTKNGAVIGLWKCDCGKEKEMISSNIIVGSTKSCGCMRRTYRFTGFKEISGKFYTTIKNQSAKKRNLDFFPGWDDDKIKKYLWKLYKQQNKKCVLSGTPIRFEVKSYRSKGSKYSNGTASLDRIDSSKGYVEGNVQWTHKDVNVAKQDMSDEDFINLCEAVYKHKRIFRL